MAAFNMSLPASILGFSGDLSLTPHPPPTPPPYHLHFTAAICRSRYGSVWGTSFAEETGGGQQVTGACSPLPRNTMHVFDRVFQSWHTATQYQLLHSVALLSLHAASKSGKSAHQYDLAAKLWISGTVLFSGMLSHSTRMFAVLNCFLPTGSIYCLCLGGPRLLGPVTPVGGLLLMAGWLAFGNAAAGQSA